MKKNSERVKNKTEPSAYLYLLLPNGYAIDSNTVDLVKQHIKNSTLNELNLVIQSSGGDPYSAVKIIRILRRKFTKIVGVVPSYAMSAATLMLLGTSEIYMGEDSQLGPLDLPLEHPADGSNISALDVVNALSQLGSSATILARDIYTQLRSGTIRLGKEAAAKLALATAYNHIQPITSKLDPYHIQSGYRKLKIAQWYAFDLLTSGMMKGKTKKAWDTATKFVHYFPDHSYAIFKDEVISALKLSVKNADDFPKWEEVCNNVKSRMQGSTSVIVEYTEE